MTRTVTSRLGGFELAFQNVDGRIVTCTLPGFEWLPLLFFFFFFTDGKDIRIIGTSVLVREVVLVNRTRKRERERERERERDRDRERQRETERNREREIETETERSRACYTFGV